MRLVLAIELRFLFRIALFCTISIFPNLFSQILDVGISLSQNPDAQVRDSLDYYITEGRTPTFSLAIEGGALEITGDGVESVSFNLMSEESLNKNIPARLFNNQDLGNLISTFQFPWKSGEKYFTYKIISKSPIIINEVFIFRQDDEDSKGLTRPMTSLKANVPKPVIITREEWGANPPNRSYSYHPYFDKLTLHHAACCSAENIEEGINQVKWIQEFHQDGRGWNDIAYHFLVDRAGNIYQGRPETVIGSHVGGANTGNIGVCLLGCYHPPEENCYETMTNESRQSIIKLYGWISDTYGPNPGVLLGHRDYFGTTACPGNNVWNELMVMRFEIDDYIESSQVSLISFKGAPYPNPFSKDVSFKFNTIESYMIKINIFDLLGRNISTITGTGVGEIILNWNGKNRDGRQMSSGLYFAKSNLLDQPDPIKLVLINE
jgi:hypothetical protein